MARRPYRGGFSSTYTKHCPPLRGGGAADPPLRGRLFTHENPDDPKTENRKPKFIPSLGLRAGVRDQAAPATRRGSTRGTGQKPRKPHPLAERGG